MTRLSRPLLRRFGKDESGVISVMGAMMLLLALAVAMIVVDTGALLYAKREQQAATDAAALGAVRQLDNPQAAAEAIFSLNDYATTNVQARGIYYVSDASRAPAERYFEEGETASDGTVVDANNVNAVRVRQLTDSPTYFARLFGFGNMTDIETVAVAALNKYVSFSAGTGLASFDSQRGALTNRIFGGLLGTEIHLDVGDYNALTGANIDALEFLDALAALNADVEVGSDTYSDLLNTSMSVGKVLNATINALNSDKATGDRSRARLVLQTALEPLQYTDLPLDQLLDATPFLSRTIGSIQSAVGNDIPYNVFDLLSGSAMILGTGKVVDFNTNVNVGSLASVSGTISVGEPMVHMAVGKVGDSVRTSQVDIQLHAGMSVPLLGRVLDIPIYIHAAQGIATVSGIPCETDGTRVVLSGTTSAGVARFGTSSGSGSVSVPLVLSFNISGSVPIGASGPTNVSFTEAEFDTPKPLSSEVNVLSELGGAVSITNLKLLGFLPLPVDPVLSALLSAVGNALSPLEQRVLNPLLDALGIKLGTMDMIVHGAKCNAPTLVG